jgi:hypothetical protein
MLDNLLLRSIKGENSMIHKKIAAGFALVALVIGASASTVGASASVDRIEGPFITVVPVALSDNPLGVELSFVECDFIQRVEKPDGSSVETQKCHLTESVPGFEGHPPERAFVNTTTDPCIWFSDYFALTTGEDVFANNVRLTVTPSGSVSVTTKYPAERTNCPG